MPLNQTLPATGSIRKRRFLDSGRRKANGEQRPTPPREKGSLPGVVARALRRDHHLLLETAPGSSQAPTWLRPVIEDALAGQGQVLIVTDTDHRRQLLLDEIIKQGFGDSIRIDTALLYDERGEAQLAAPDVSKAALVFSDFPTLFSRLEARPNGTIDCHLPPHLVIVLDEAHILEDLARSAFGFSLSMKEARSIVRELEEVGFHENAARLREEAAEFFRQIAAYEASSSYRIRLTKACPVQEDQLLKALEETADALNPSRKRFPPRDPRKRHVFEGVVRLAECLLDATHLQEENVVTLGLDPELLGVITSHPVGVDRQLGALFDAARSVILVSETLTTAGSFHPLRDSLGVPDTTMEYVAVPKKSDLPKLLLVVPEQLPDPSERDWPNAVTCRFVDIQKATGGRACGVFTSDAVISRVQEHLRYLRARVRRCSVDGPARVDLVPPEASDGQGEDPAAAEESYTCVIIDRLPFPPPDDPCLHYFKDADPAWFSRYSLPRAIIAMRRAILPLLKGKAKRAVLVVLDRRLLTRSYSRLFLDSLPDLTLSNRIDDIPAFLEGNGKPR